MRSGAVHLTAGRGVRAQVLAARLVWWHWLAVPQTPERGVRPRTHKLALPRYDDAFCDDKKKWRHLDEVCRAVRVQLLEASEDLPLVRKFPLRSDPPSLSAAIVDELRSGGNIRDVREGRARVSRHLRLEAARRRANTGLERRSPRWQNRQRLRPDWIRALICRIADACEDSSDRVAGAR
jgi:hypothetical protein